MYKDKRIFLSVLLECVEKVEIEGGKIEVVHPQVKRLFRSKVLSKESLYYKNFNSFFSNGVTSSPSIFLSVLLFNF